MFLTLDIFLKHFPSITMTREQFKYKFTVMYAIPQTLNDIFSLVPSKYSKAGNPKLVIKDATKDRRYLRQEDIIDYFYEIIITGRHKYLSCFYKAYFEFKDPMSLDWNTSDCKKILSTPEIFKPYSVVSSQKNDASRRIVRNLFYLQLLDETRITNTVKSHVSFWTSLCNMYNKLQLEDRFFAPSSIDTFLKEKKTIKDGITINYNALYYIFQMYQPKASIFNPYTIKWTMDNLLVPHIKTKTIKGNLSIFTPVLSWGSYLIAYMHSTDFNKYVGVDVMPTVCKKCEFLGKWYRNLSTKFKNKKTEFYCQPSESLLHNKSFKYNNTFDCALICPPYYDMELYSEGKQSIDTYKDYNSWINGYWEQTVKLCHICLQSGGVFAFIGNDYNSLKNKTITLTKDLQNITEKYFKLVNMVYLQNRTAPMRVNAKDRTERMYIYIKT